MSERLECELELKSVDVSQRLIDGYASVTNVEDDGGDVIDSGAFADALEGRAPSSVPVFVGHQHGSLPVGMPLVITEDAFGLFTRTKIHNTAVGDDLLATARERQAAGSPLGMSIGYNVRDHGYKAGKRHIKSLSLGEYSFTAIPMNRAAVVTAVKERSEFWDEFLKDQEELELGLALVKAQQAVLDRR